MTQFIVNSVWRHYTDPHLICPKIGFCKKQYVKRDLEKDIAKIIEDKPNREWEVPSEKKKLKIMHISDLHPDLYYTVGAPADCSEPVCCRAGVNKSINMREEFQKIARG